MKRVFFIVGPTAVGKSDLAAEVAHQIGAEILSADAFQIYRGLDLLTAKPDRETLAKVPHHLISVAPLSEPMHAEKFRAAAEEIIDRGTPVIVVGGTGLYIKTLTHGLADLPGASETLRAKLGAATNQELFRSLERLDQAGAENIDRNNRRRLIRAVEVCLLTGEPFSKQRKEWNNVPESHGILLSRARDDLYARINQRVEEMFRAGVVEEVRETTHVGPTAEKTLGLREIRALIAGEISASECIAQIQQATRRYAKRQLTWFRRQTNFPSLNLSAHRRSEAIELISQGASRVLAPND